MGNLGQTRDLTVLVGGATDVLERCRPVLDAMAKTVIHVGPIGAGCICKIAHNCASFVRSMALMECLTLGVKAGVAPDVLIDAFNRGALGTNLDLRVRLPATVFQGGLQAALRPQDGPQGHHAGHRAGGGGGRAGPARRGVQGRNERGAGVTAQRLCPPLTVKRKCPHEGACDIDAERADKASGSQQFDGGPYDHGAGSDFDGSERAPHQAYSGGLQQGGSSRTRSRQSRSQTGQRYIGPVGDRRGGPWRGTRYAGVNHTHLSELLREREGIDIGRNTLRKILTDAGMNSPRRRRPPKHRVRRQRMTREGMLIQIDGSYHRWLGEDGPQFTLLLAVDDATGCVVNALFCEQENTPQLLTADAGSDTELRHTARTLFRPPWRLQAHAAVGDRRRSHPVLARYG